MVQGDPVRVVQHLPRMHEVPGLIPHAVTMTKKRGEESSGEKKERTVLAQISLTSRGNETMVNYSKGENHKTLTILYKHKQNGRHRSAF